MLFTSYSQAGGVLPAVRLESNFGGKMRQDYLPNLPKYIFGKIEFEVDPPEDHENAGESRHLC